MPIDDMLRPKWSHAAALTRTKLPQFASLIPLLGYAVLWGNQFKEWIMRFDKTLGADLWLDPLMRVYLLYTGSVSILLGLAIFYMLCPRQVRMHRDRKEYIEWVQGSFATNELRLATKAIEYAPKGAEHFGIIVSANAWNSAANGSLDGHVPPLLMAYFEKLDRSRAIACFLCLAFLGVGTLVFLTPSLEVFVMAATRILATIFPSST